MLYSNKKADEGINYIKERRCWANPNPYFRSQLKEFETELINPEIDCIKNKEKDMTDDEKTVYRKIHQEIDIIINDLRRRNC